MSYSHKYVLVAKLPKLSNVTRGRHFVSFWKQILLPAHFQMVKKLPIVIPMYLAINQVFKIQYFLIRNLEMERTLNIYFAVVFLFSLWP